MITISEAVARRVQQTPFLEKALAEGLINLSALARQMRAGLQAELVRPVSEAAVMMALKRLAPRLQRQGSGAAGNWGPLDDLTVRSNLVEFTFQRSPTVLPNLKKLLEAAAARQEAFLAHTQGVHEVTLVASASLAPVIDSLFRGERTIARLENLASITIRLGPQTVHTVGVYYALLRQLAWENINVVEVVSTFMEFTIIMERTEIDRAFSILKQPLRP